MARYEIADAVKNVASIYKSAAHYGSIERKARLNVGKIKRQTNLTVKYAVQCTVRLITEACFSIPRVVLEHKKMNMFSIQRNARIRNFTICLRRDQKITA